MEDDVGLLHQPLESFFIYSFLIVHFSIKVKNLDVERDILSKPWVKSYLAEGYSIGGVWLKHSIDNVFGLR